MAFEVNIESIKAEIERLKTLNADEYLADKFAELKAEFEAKREKNIAELENALVVCEKYQVVEEEEETEDGTEDGKAEEQIVEE